MRFLNDVVFSKIKTAYQTGIHVEPAWYLTADTVFGHLHELTQTSSRCSPLFPTSDWPTRTSIIFSQVESASDWPEKRRR